VVKRQTGREVERCSRRSREETGDAGGGHAGPHVCMYAGMHACIYEHMYVCMSVVPLLARLVSLRQESRVKFPQPLKVIVRATDHCCPPADTPALPSRLPDPAARTSQRSGK